MGDIFDAYMFKTQCYVLENGGDDLRGAETVAIGALKNTKKFCKEANFWLETEWLEIEIHISENEGKRIIADSLEPHNVWVFQLLNDSSFLYKRFLIRYVLVEQFLSDDFLRSGWFPTRTRKSLPVAVNTAPYAPLWMISLFVKHLKLQTGRPEQRMVGLKKRKLKSHNPAWFNSTQSEQKANFLQHVELAQMRNKISCS